MCLPTAELYSADDGALDKQRDDQIDSQNIRNITFNINTWKEKNLR